MSKLGWKKISAATLLLLACQGLLLLALPLISRRLGQSGYGELGLAMWASMCAYQFIQWGMDQLLTVKFARASEADTRNLLGLLLRQKQLAALVVLAAAAIFAACFSKSLERPLIFLGAVDGVILAFTIPSIFDSRGRTAIWQFYAFLRHAAYLGALLILAYFFPSRFSPLAVLSLHALCIVPEVLLEQLWIQKNAGLPRWPAPPREALTLWRDAAPMALAMLAQQLLFYMGVPALKQFGRESEMGAITLSTQLTMVAASFFAAPAAMIQVRLAQHADSGGFVRRVLKITVMCALAGAAISLVFPHAGAAVVRLIFKNFSDSTPRILEIDAWRLTAILAGVPLSCALICRNRLRAFALCWGLALAVGAGGAAIFIPRHGARGAAGSIVAGCFAFCLCALIAVIFDPRNHAAERTS